MARAEIRTKLPLDRWAALVGINPIHFNGVYVDTPTVCAQPWMQFPWQAVDRVGREDVAQAISEAEASLEGFLGYRLLPSWEEDEWRPTLRPSRPELFNLSATDIRGLGSAVRTNWGYLVSGGAQAATLIEAGAAIAYTDEDGDSYDEIATVSVTVDQGQDGCELRVYFPVSNTMVQTGGEDQWEIRPISVSVSGTTATIRFRRELCVLPELQLDIVPPEGDDHLRGVDGSSPAGDGNFLTTADVYRVYNDPQTQVSFLWYPLGTGCGCNGTGCNLCAYATQTGCLIGVGEPRHGFVRWSPGSWNATDENFDSEEYTVSRNPDIVRLWYRAGWQAPDRACPVVQMDREWERVVAYYAAALLDRPVCECNNVHAWIERWRRDLAFTTAERSPNISAADLDNPFGTRAGAIWAWRRIKREGPKGAIGRAVIL